MIATIKKSVLYVWRALGPWWSLFIAVATGASTRWEDLCTWLLARGAPGWLAANVLIVPGWTVAALVFCLLMAVFLGLRVIRLEREKEPKLRLAFDSTKNRHLTPTMMTVRGAGGPQAYHCIYVRVLPICESQIRNCTAYLTGVYVQASSGDWEETEFDERLELSWSNGSCDPILLDPDAPQCFDVFYVTELEQRIVPCVRVLPNRASNVFKRNKVYRLDLLVIGGDGARAAMSLIVEQTQDWRRPRVREITARELGARRVPASAVYS